ncbi:MAG: hypothetical protein L0H79_04030 [Intrasporangium sp.]|uniref:sunset domain-containing protein n=1 Tax=Intrasporangium sp. TaxID=1925024 RepID=UPI0026482BE8|nr:hypothetical protein [Intrasporangium sp.]MDN5794902.1 hypothetical protein [Intrasporangium sp.]
MSDFTTLILWIALAAAVIASLFVASSRRRQEERRRAARSLPAHAALPPVAVPRVVDRTPVMDRASVLEPVGAPASTDHGTATRTLAEPAVEVVCAVASAGEPAGAEAGELDVALPPPARRISSLAEVRDGGYGVGSAAPIRDGAQPLGHGVKAVRGTGTYLVPGSPGYEDVEPDVWFYDERAAYHFGYRPTSGG